MAILSFHDANESSSFESCDVVGDRVMPLLHERLRAGGLSVGTEEQHENPKQGRLAVGATAPEEKQGLLNRESGEAIPERPLNEADDVRLAIENFVKER